MCIGALFPWRYALGIVIVVPVTTLFLLFFCPETPVWLLSKGKTEEAKNVLTRLRGAENVDIIETEFNRISINVKIIQKEDEINESDNSLFEKIKEFFNLLIGEYKLEKRHFYTLYLILWCLLSMCIVPLKMVPLSKMLFDIPIYQKIKL